MDGLEEVSDLYGALLEDGFDVVYTDSPELDEDRPGLLTVAGCSGYGPVTWGVCRADDPQTVGIVSSESEQVSRICYAAEHALETVLGKQNRDRLHAVAVPEGEYGIKLKASFEYGGKVRSTERTLEYDFVIDDIIAVAEDLIGRKMGYDE